MFLYRLLLTLASPIVVVWLAVQLLRRRATAADLVERLGLGGPATPPSGQVVWLHGASNGELTSARTLIETLLQRDPSLRIVVTTNTRTGRDMVRDWKLPRLRARLAPLDYRACLWAFLNSHRPAVLLLLEGDLWPNRMDVAAVRGTPIAMISARISERSARKWQHFSGLCVKMLRSVVLLSPQDPDSARRFLALGLPPESLRPNLTLKATVALPAPDPQHLDDYRKCFIRADTVLAASTHAGEEEQVLAAFEAARRERPALRMILAPRHPDRSGDVTESLQRAGISFRTRSMDEAPDRTSDVYLADTLGEMPLWYSLAGQCFVGGSLVPKGGHTPFEPAEFGCAILHGPSLHNFLAQYQDLDANDGAILTADAEALGTALGGLDASRCAELVANATRALDLGGLSLEPLLEDLATTAGLYGLTRTDEPPSS